MVENISPQEEQSVVSLLSDREQRIVSLARQGTTDKEIADELGMSVASLRTHWNRIREKLGAVNRTHAIALSTDDSPLTEAKGDERTRLAETMMRGRVATWIWSGNNQNALLDDLGREMFDLGVSERSVGLDRMLTRVWRPDRARFERYLCQAGDLRPMTPIELRVGSPGDYRRLIRTVNLTSAPDGASATKLVLATTIMHLFDAGGV